MDGAQQTLYGGVETGGSWCVCALGTGPGELLALEKFPTGAPDPTIARIVDFFTRHPGAATIGVGSFGPVELDEGSPHWGELLATTPKREWAGVPVGPRLRDALGVEVVFETDVNAAAVGEQRWGAGRGVESLCYLTIGTGVGAGIIIGGRPVHGLRHPEAGHVRIPHDLSRDPFPGACPFHGDCLEGLAGGGALALRWGVNPSELPDDHPAWELETEYVAAGILAIVMVASPGRVIAGGGVMDRPLLRPRVRARLAELIGGYLDRPELAGDLGDYVVAPELGDDAGVLGAIALASDRARRSGGRTFLRTSPSG